ncbi:very short patch repair endonuclease [Chloroflexota bacterium]
MDKLSKERRSWNMSRIRAKNTKPEVVVRSMLHRMGYRFRIHFKGLPGKPDIVLSKYHTAIFVHGCFWHGHEGCKDFAPPKTRTEWWLNKINGNKKKDAENIAQLNRQGWQVTTIWECELTPDKRENTIESLVDVLSSKI